MLRPLARSSSLPVSCPARRRDPQPTVRGDLWPTLRGDLWPTLRRALRPTLRRALHLALPLAFACSALPGVAQAQADGEPRGVDDGGEAGLLVLAAASLSEALTAAAAAWEDRGGAPVRLSLAATSRLAPQAVHGGADVFLSADREWMEWLAARGAVLEGSVVPIASNELVLVVPRGDRPEGRPPRGPAGVEDLAASGVRRLALAGASVPAGRYARAALAEAGVWDAVRGKVVRGGSARGALEWVARGEADAGVVYVTDARVEPRVRVAFALPGGSSAGIGYWGAVLSGTPRPADAGEFLAFLAAGPGREILRERGFAPPGEGGWDEHGGGAGDRGEATVGGRRGTGSGEGDSGLPDPASAILLSLGVALLATLAGGPPAVLLGWILARHRFPGKTVLSGVVLAPLVLPPVVTGFLLLTLLGRSSVLGGWLAAIGMPVPFTFLGAAVAAFVVGLPLYVVVTRGAFEAVDPRLEEVSWTLGRPRRETFRRITLPLALPGIAAGAVLAFARALGEFGATVVLAGNVEGETRTIALAVYTLLESPGGGRLVWGLVIASLLLSLAALAAYEALSRRQRRLREEHRGR